MNNNRHDKIKINEKEGKIITFNVKFNILLVLYEYREITES